MPGKTSNRNHRNYRNNPYILDDLAFRVHRSAAGVIWRMRTELITLTAAASGFIALAHVIATVGAGIVLTTSMAVITAVPHSRRFVIRRAWCVLSRHRMQRVFFETRMHTRSGRLSLVLRIHPTEVGERALIWCRAGICFDDFEDHIGEIAAACYAREARVERSKRWAQIVIVHIVRRDTLAAHNVIPSGLAPKLPAPAPDDERTTA
jgi:hypothetical protein